MSDTLQKIGDMTEKVRSKNAGPFWLTIDIFCGTPEAFATVSAGLSTDQMATLMGTTSDQIKRFYIPSLNVVKFSLPRPTVQGARDDRDMHGAGWAPLIAELELG